METEEKLKLKKKRWEMSFEERAQNMTEEEKENFVRLKQLAKQREGARQIIEKEPWRDVM